MPAVQGYFGTELQALVTLTGSGAAVHVRTRDDCTALCDVRFSRAELRAMLARCDDIAELADTVELTAAQVAAVKSAAAAEG